MREMFRSKIHRATVTHANLAYEGSVTIDDDLLKAADILEFEKVHVWNVTRGTRLVTYAMRGEPGSGVICINGAAAHLVSPGDLVIIATFAQFSDMFICADNLRKGAALNAVQIAELLVEKGMVRGCGDGCGCRH